MNLGLWRLWDKMENQGKISLLAQTYDSVTFQYKDLGHEHEAKIIKEALELIRVKLTSPSGRDYIVPGEAKVGWNWGGMVTEQDQERAEKEGRKIPRLNPNGLRKFSFSSPDERRRKESESPTSSWLRQDLMSFVK